MNINNEYLNMLKLILLVINNIQISIFSYRKKAATIR